jgi:DNA polymerase-1
LVADVIDQALRIRTLDKLAGTYFENFIDMADADNLLHPEIRTLGARTGRQSVSSPALQTLPSRDPSPEARAVRQAMLPRYEDEVILACDADQIELRLAGSMANDAALIEAFRLADEEGGLDFFTQSVRAVHGDPEATKADPRRSPIKNFWYSNLYGAGVPKMAATAKVPVSEMEVISRGITAAYPQYARLGSQVQNLARQNDFTVTTAYGRVLPVDEEKIYASTNYLIQGTAADILKRATIDIAQAGLEDALLITVHDEIVVSVAPEDTEEVSHILEASMTNHDFRIPLTAGCSPPVSRWGDAK